MTIRDDKLSFDPDCYCGEGVPVDKDGMCTGPKALQNKLGDWNEWYVDIHSKKCKKHIQKIMKKRIKAAAKKGCDGVDPDNVDEVCRFHCFVDHHANLSIVLEPSDLQHHRAGPGRLLIMVVQDCSKGTPGSQSQECRKSPYRPRDRQCYQVPNGLGRGFRLQRSRTMCEYSSRLDMK
jgi:hypothetical protein